MNVLYVENNVHFYNAVKKEFFSEYKLSSVPTIREAIEELAENQYDLVLVDYDLDDGKGVVLVKEIRKTNNKIPIIAVSSHEEGNSEMLCSGANAYCKKLDFKNIISVIQGVLQ